MSGNLFKELLFPASAGSQAKSSLSQTTLYVALAPPHKLLRICGFFFLINKETSSFLCNDCYGFFFSLLCPPCPSNASCQYSFHVLLRGSS